MARLLIKSSALAELRALPRATRREVLHVVSALADPPPSHRIAVGGRCRLSTRGWRALYGSRRDGTLVLTAFQVSEDAVDSAH